MIFCGTNSEQNTLVLYSIGGLSVIRCSSYTVIGHGVFGVRTFRVENTLFWGFDSLDLLTLYLQSNDPLPQDAVGQIMGLPASAKRT